MTPHQTDGTDGVVGAGSPGDEADAQQDRHDRELRESLQEERRLLRWEVLCLVLVLVFVVVRQLWLT
ncbi:MAG: hypothetical protein WA892_05505 [Ornithinimicrobium sp.]